jgi:CMP-N-acetylneuraminic acid synthetase
MRPTELASDSARSVDVAIHALDRYEAERGAVDGLLLLQPTSPFRTTASIRKGIELFRRGGGLPVLGVSPILTNPAWTYLIDNGLLKPFSDAPQSCSTTWPQYVVNGAFYLVSGSHLREHGSFTANRTIPLVFESEVESLDIDTALDFILAEAIASTASHQDASSGAGLMPSQY